MSLPDRFAFERRVQELLDARVDPLDDARVQDWLLEHPEALESFAGMRAVALTLESAPPAAAPRPTGLPRRVLPWAAAAAAMLAVLPWLPGGEDAADVAGSVPVAALPVAAPSPPPAVERAELVAGRWTPEGARQTRTSLVPRHVAEEPAATTAHRARLVVPADASPDASTRPAPGVVALTLDVTRTR